MLSLLEDGDEEWECMSIRSDASEGEIGVWDWIGLQGWRLNFSYTLGLYFVFLLMVPMWVMNG